ncbi:hypothetical protein ISS37_07835 [candidate division KSB1 bacterium]|nr:hypothetical protein [candidate division KSB1 bacterium]
MEINLEFETKIDPEFLAAGIPVRLIRLLATLQFLTSEGWSRRYQGIIDTGNPISVIPHFIWNNAQLKWISSEKTKLYGIGSAGVWGRLAEMTITFSDEKRVSLPISLKAHLLDDNSVPLLIGFEDVLTSLKLVSDYKEQKAYLKW